MLQNGSKVSVVDHWRHNMLNESGHAKGLGSGLHSKRPYIQSLHIPACHT